MIIKSLSFRKQNLLNVTLICVAIATLYILLLRYGTLETARLRIQDFFFDTARVIKPVPEEISNITVVEIDDSSLQNMGGRWPWDREIFARFLRVLNKYNPRIIGMDIAFVGKGRTAEEDSALAEALDQGKNVILGAYFNEDGDYIRPESIFARAALDNAFVNKPMDRDLKVRRLRDAVHLSEKEIEYSFVIKLIAHYFGAPVSKIEIAHNRLVVPGKEMTVDIPVSDTLTTPINFLDIGEFNRVPFWKVFRGEADEDLFRDRLVLIGMTGEIFHDTHNTPIGTIPGVLLHANSLLMILVGNFITQIPVPINTLLVFLSAVLAGIITYRNGVMRGMGLVIMVNMILSSVAAFLAFIDICGDFFGPVLVSLSSYLFVTLHKHLTLIIETGELRKLALTDELTGLFTYRYFLITLENEIGKSLRYNHPLSLIIFDVDHFKSINDTYGHEQGNTVLKKISQVLQKTHRKVDGLTRYGGDEFCIILHNTDEKGALNFANRLKDEVEKTTFEANEKTFKVTLSIGVADLDKTGAKSVHDFFEYADSALYKAKKSGRNRICTWERE